jgi:hypothetical protein
MSMNYPRLSHEHEITGAPPRCDHCGWTATWHIAVQVDFMRGNDQCSNVCAQAYALAKRGAWPAFYAAVESLRSKA